MKKLIAAVFTLSLLVAISAAPAYATGVPVIIPHPYSYTLPQQYTYQTTTTYSFSGDSTTTIPQTATSLPTTTTVPETTTTQPPLDPAILALSQLWLSISTNNDYHISLTDFHLGGKRATLVAQNDSDYDITLHPTFDGKPLPDATVKPHAALRLALPSSSALSPTKHSNVIVKYSTTAGESSQTLTLKNAHFYSVILVVLVLLALIGLITVAYLLRRPSPLTQP